MPLTATSSQVNWNVYALPAAISLGFLVVETIYLAVKLPETRSWKKTENTSSGSEASKSSIPLESTDNRLARLKAVGRLHGLFLLFFSGVSPSLRFRMRSR
jgi:hypothetical protein